MSLHQLGTDTHSLLSVGPNSGRIIGKYQCRTPREKSADRTVIHGRYCGLRATSPQSDSAAIGNLFQQERCTVIHPVSEAEERVVSEESIYMISEIVGTSTKSWEDAVKNAIAEASKHLRDLRVAEVVQMDARLENNKIVAYRAKIKLSFKYQKE